MSSINFDNPWLLIIALPIILCILVPFFWAVRKDNRNVHNITSMILHLLIAFFVAFSAAGTSIKSVLTETNVYVVADLSYSTNKHLDLIDEYVEDLRDNLPLNSEMGVVCFGATDSHLIHTPLGETPNSVKTALESGEQKIDSSATDIVSALEFTGKIFKAGVIKRIVLITDAKQSDESDAGALKRTVDALHQAEIYVDAIYLNGNLSEEEKEVQISNVEYLENVYQGKESLASVYLQSNVETRGVLKVHCDGQLIYSDPSLKISKATQKLTFPLKTDTMGTYRYSVSLEDLEQDGNGENNVWNFTQTVCSDPSVLFISGTPDDELAARKIYGSNYEKAVDFRLASEEDIPYSVVDLCKYDEIVLSNFDITTMRNCESFVDNLDKVVSLLGKSLIGLGDLHLQGTTNPVSMQLADMLPVRYGSPFSEGKLYAIVLDISNSMEQAGKFVLAKKAAKQLVDLVSDVDTVVVYGFYGGVKIIQPETRGSERETIKAAIDEEKGFHNTVISGGFEEVQKTLQNGAAREAQVFLITDGQNAATDWEKTKTIVGELNAQNGVPTSVIGIHSDLSAGNLTALASLGEGSYWNVKTESELDEVALGAGEIVGEAVVNLPARVEKKQVYDPALKGITFSNTTWVGGYLTSRAKPNAVVVATAEHLRQGGASMQVPLYTHWEYGNGKTAAFNSSFSGTWMRQWQKTDLDTAFFGNVFEASTPVQRVDSPFISTVIKQAGGARLEVRPAHLRAGDTVSVRLITPTGERTEINNVAFDSMVYSCSFALPTVGEYTAEITYTSQGKAYTKNQSVHLSYLAEYDRFVAFDASPLYGMLGANGVVSEDGKLTLENDEDEVGVRIVDLTLPLLVVAVVLFAVDIIIRKLKWADIRGLFCKTRKGGRL